MRRDKQYPDFFTGMSLVCFAMLALFLSGTLLQWLVFLQIAGLAVFLLIGFWHEKPTARAAAIKAFLFGRFGDIGLIVGIGIVFHLLGSAIAVADGPMAGRSGRIGQFFRLAGLE